MSTPHDPYLQASASDSQPFTRRDLLKYSAASAAGVTLVDAHALNAQSTQPSPQHAAPSSPNAVDASSASPRNIIFMISDGMSAAVPGMAQAFSQLVRKRDTHWSRLASNPRTSHGQFDMASLNSLVTDSAAASSAWATGSRVFNHAINTLPDGTKLTPIGALAKQAGRAVGLVTTTRITHATPAGFAACVASRQDEAEIATQYLNVVDVLLGGGLKFFSPLLRKDKRDLLQEYRDQQYTIFNAGDALRVVASQKKILGLFDEDHIPYTIDRNREPALRQQIPTLAEMTQFALPILKRTSESGFLLQIEGGRIDHAAHNNDAAAMLWDQLAFDDAMGVAIEFCKQNPDTLLLITSDHGCGNPGLNGVGTQYEKSTQHFQRLQSATASVEAMEARLKNIARKRADHQVDEGADRKNSSLTVDDVRDVLKWGTGLDITAKDATVIVDVLAGMPAPDLNVLEANIYGVVAQIIGNHTGIGWTGITHTADWTPILAFGPASNQFDGLLKNTSAYVRLAKFLGVTHRNASMTEAQAQSVSVKP